MQCDCSLCVVMLSVEPLVHWGVAKYASKGARFSQGMNESIILVAISARTKESMLGKPGTNWPPYARLTSLL